MSRYLPSPTLPSREKVVDRPCSQGLLCFRFPTPPLDADPLALVALTCRLLRFRVVPLDARRGTPYPIGMNAFDLEHPVVIFDGECGFCDATVDFILEHDPAGVFRFASRQSAAGKRLLLSHGLPEGGVGSIVLVEDGIVHTHSPASLRIARRLRGGWRVLHAFSVVPSPIRDAVYGFVSRNRTRVLGKREVCSVPTPERRARFLPETAPLPQT